MIWPKPLEEICSKRTFLEYFLSFQASLGLVQVLPSVVSIGVRLLMHAVDYRYSALSGGPDGFM